MTNRLVVSIILNTNRREDTLECLRSLTQQTYENMHTIVLDNHSTDGSVDAIKTEFPDVEVIPILENLGYAGNNNVGIRTAFDRQADWIFVLNEDTVLHEDCVQTLVGLGEMDTNIGAVGPLVYHFDEPEYIQTGGGMLDKNWDTWHIAQNDLFQYSSTLHQILGK